MALDSPSEIAVDPSIPAFVTQAWSQQGKQHPGSLERQRVPLGFWDSLLKAQPRAFSHRSPSDFVSTCFPETNVNLA